MYVLTNWVRSGRGTDERIGDITDASAAIRVIGAEAVILPAACSAESALKAPVLRSRRVAAATVQGANEATGGVGDVPRAGADTPLPASIWIVAVVGKTVGEDEPVSVPSFSPTVVSGCAASVCWGSPIAVGDSGKSVELSSSSSVAPDEPAFSITESTTGRTIRDGLVTPRTRLAVVVDDASLPLAERGPAVVETEERSPPDGPAGSDCAVSPELEPASDGEVEFDVAESASVSADAAPAPARTAAPTPKATANPPTRPMYLDSPIFSSKSSYAARDRVAPITIGARL